jgi:hypothetical protein
MTLIILWIAASAAIGWFGRKRVIGFWGFFVLSLLVSPVITGLFLLVAAPGKRYINETEQRVAATLRRTALPTPATAVSPLANDPIAAHARTPGMRMLMLAWLVTVAVFAVLYLVTGGNAAGQSLTASFDLVDAARLSFDIGTLGSGRDDVAASPVVTWLASAQRLVVLGILVLMVSSLISARLAVLREKDRRPADRVEPPAIDDPTSVQL